jgi:hypothetical protein
MATAGAQTDNAQHRRESHPDILHGRSRLQRHDDKRSDPFTPRISDIAGPRRRDLLHGAPPDSEFSNHAAQPETGQGYYPATMAEASFTLSFGRSRVMDATAVLIVRHRQAYLPQNI